MNYWIMRSMSLDVYTYFVRHHGHVENKDDHDEHCNHRNPTNNPWHTFSFGKEQLLFESNRVNSFSNRFDEILRSWSLSGIFEICCPPRVRKRCSLSFPELHHGNRPNNHEHREEDTLNIANKWIESPHQTVFGKIIWFADIVTDGAHGVLVSVVAHVIGRDVPKHHDHIEHHHNDADDGGSNLVNHLKSGYCKLMKNEECKFAKVGLV